MTAYRDYRMNCKAFIVECTANGVGLITASRLLTLANRHQLICLMQINERVGDKFDTEEKQLERCIAKCVGGGIKSIQIDGDARGATVKIFFKSGAANSFGVAGAYCVPTYVTMEIAASMAKQNPQNWE